MGKKTIQDLIKQEAAKLLGTEDNLTDAQLHQALVEANKEEAPESTEGSEANTEEAPEGANDASTEDQKDQTDTPEDAEDDEQEERPGESIEELKSKVSTLEGTVADLKEILSKKDAEIPSADDGADDKNLNQTKSYFEMSDEERPF